MNKIKYITNISSTFFGSKKYFVISGIIIFIILLLYACHKDNITSENLFTGKSYFPLKINSEIIYQITEINIDKASAVYDTVSYIIKERIDSLFTDATNNSAYRIERYILQDTLNRWVIKDVWEAQVNDLNAQKVEENIRYVKLVFPVEIGTIWNGNAYNNLGNQNYQIVEANIPENINGLTFDSVVTVEQENEISLISKKYAVEKFALGIGLVYKEVTNLYSQSMIGSNIPIEERIDEGTIYKQEIIAYLR
ncbi:MAG TPA: hypothetical protein EYP69_02650 [Bacteroidales bacterium]|nr:hypothetical protein [Bacteroidales bacterium]